MIKERTSVKYNLSIVNLLILTKFNPVYSCGDFFKSTVGKIERLCIQKSACVDEIGLPLEDQERSVNAYRVSSQHMLRVGMMIIISSLIMR